MLLNDTKDPTLQGPFTVSSKSLAPKNPRHGQGTSWNLPLHPLPLANLGRQEKVGDKVGDKEILNFCAIETCVHMNECHTLLDLFQVQTGHSTHVQLQTSSNSAISMFPANPDALSTLVASVQTHDTLVSTSKNTAAIAKHNGPAL